MTTNKISPSFLINVYEKLGFMPTTEHYLKEETKTACAIGILAKYFNFTNKERYMINHSTFVAQKLNIDVIYVRGFEEGFMSWEKTELDDNGGYEDGKLAANEVAKVFGEFRQAALDIAG